MQTDQPWALRLAVKLLRDIDDAAECCQAILGYDTTALQTALAKAQHEAELLQGRIRRPPAAPGAPDA